MWRKRKTRPTPLVPEQFKHDIRREVVGQHGQDDPQHRAEETGDVKPHEWQQEDDEDHHHGNRLMALIEFAALVFFQLGGEGEFGAERHRTSIAQGRGWVI